MPKGEGRDDRFGKTAWLLTARALVLFMTLPGLALFTEEQGLDLRLHGETGMVN
jgi:hypothetical protein